jgi:hypothetical protein
MTLDRSLVHILAAIVMIVAYFVPSAVQAHAGHAHTQPQLVTVTALDPGSARLDISAVVAAVATEIEAAQVTADTAYPADPDTPGPTKRCNGLCCGSASAACCAHALAPELGLSPTPSAARLIAIANALARPGIDPEALPKPPKTFA